MQVAEVMAPEILIMKITLWAEDAGRGSEIWELCVGTTAITIHCIETML